MTIPSDYRYHPVTSRSKRIAFNALVEHRVRCSHCHKVIRFEIVLDHRHAFMECKCPSCYTAKLFDTFNFCIMYMSDHLPEHELIKEAQYTMSKHNVVNSLPITKFVQNFVEFNKTLE